MIPLLALLGLSAHADTAMLEETRGVVGRELAGIPGSTAARELSDQGRWAEAAVAVSYTHLTLPTKCWV